MHILLDRTKFLFVSIIPLIEVLFNFGIICKIEFWSKGVSTDFFEKYKLGLQICLEP